MKGRGRRKHDDRVAVLCDGAPSGGRLRRADALALQGNRRRADRDGYPAVSAQQPRLRYRAGYLHLSPAQARAGFALHRESGAARLSGARGRAGGSAQMSAGADGGGRARGGKGAGASGGVHRAHAGGAVARGAGGGAALPERHHGKHSKHQRERICLVCKPEIRRFWARSRSAGC